MNKYTFRRFIASIITIPIAMGLYLLLWVGLIAYGAEGTFQTYQENLSLISVVWVLAWTFGPDVTRYLEKREQNQD